MTYTKPVDDQSYLINSSNYQQLQESAKSNPNSFWLEIANTSLLPQSLGNNFDTFYRFETWNRIQKNV